MAVVPYTFADQTGSIPLSELDANFANVKAFAVTAGNVTGNIQSNITAVGTLTTLSVSGNIIAGNISAPGLNTQILFNDGGIANASSALTFNKTSNTLAVNGTITASFLSASGGIITSSFVNANTISVSGNITSNNLLASNGFVIANLVVSSSGEFGISSGQTILSLANVRAETIYIGDQKGTNVYIANTTSNVYFGGNTTANGWVYGDAFFSGSGNIGVAVGVTTMRIGNIRPTTIWIGGNAGNINIANVNSLTQISGNLVVGASFSATGNITSLANVVGNNILTSGTVSAAGAVTGGNILTAGEVSAVGNITGGNIIGTIVGTVATTTISASGNITGANIRTGGLITATGNIQAGNLRTTGLITATGNVDAGNIRTAGLVSATGNIAGGNLSVVGTSTLTGVATAPTAANGTSNTQVATTAFVTNSMLNLVPSGVIVMWSGTIASIPSGWLLCNGTSGTPDLRDRFVVGAGSTYAVGATGGSADAIVVAHTHTASSVVSDPGHNHSSGNFNRLLQVDGTGTVTSTNFDPTEPNVLTTGNIQSNTTGITVSTTINSAGSSATNANLPPYYALAYIMKA